MYSKQIVIMSTNDISELSSVIDSSIVIKPNVVRQSKNRELLEKWNRNGGNIPICINYILCKFRLNCLKFKSF